MQALTKQLKLFKAVCAGLIRVSTESSALTSKNTYTAAINFLHNLLAIKDNIPQQTFNKFSATIHSEYTS